ncbi:uncharacterized protein LOC136077090 [Hydra vulgaris]|uniref:Uncharacterized protein LOC136077090 n=1 Tax=Hydra vulgaris TaxID=6087 RepID=A0ABM4BFH1_HYDVU
MGPHKKTNLFYGKAKTYLACNFPIPAHLNIGCRNGHVLHIFATNNDSYKVTVELIGKYFNIKTCISQIQQLVRTSKVFVNHFSRNSKPFVDICNMLFAYQITTSAVAQTSQLNATSIDFPTCSSFSSQQISVSSVSNSDHLSPLSRPTLKTSSHEPLSSLRADQLSPRKKVMRKRLTILANEMAIKKRKHKEDIKGLKDKTKARAYRFKYLNQVITRKEKLISQLRKKLKEKFLNLQLKKLQNHIFCLKQQLTSTQRKFSYQKAMLSHQLAEKNAAILVLQNDILSLQEELEEIQQVTQNTKNEKCYSADIRRLIYDMLVCQVPTQSVPSLLRKIGEHTGYRFSQIPHRTTVEQMMRELGVLSDIQAAEIAFTTKDLTLGFDATTQEGVHVNAVHLTTESVCMVVAIDQLPGGTAYDYQSHITKSIDNLAKLYSDFYQLKYTNVRSTIIGNITNTMSDRVATNHATIAKLNLVWQKSLNELNCHLHPLDTMTSSCKSSLKALETSKGKLFGIDCIAANIVIQLNKLRYKDAKGDPKGFVTFLDQHELPRGLLPRYRGNRLHMLFHTCGILIHHYAILKIFLCSGLALCGGLRNSLFQDFTSETGIRELCVLALIGKLLSGPWMTKFYIAPGTGLDYISGIQVVKDVRNTLIESSKNPLSLLKRKTDFFGNDIEDVVFDSIISFCPVTDEMSKALADCLNAVISVIDRQYKRQFEMSSNDHLKDQPKSARLHNIGSEELMGMFSTAKHKAPNATLCFLSSKLRACKNKTTALLCKKPNDIQNKLILWAISNARKKRFTNMQCHNDLKLELIKRIADKIQKKKTKNAEM